MAVGETDSPALRKKLNRLYWTSDRSVNQITEDLGVSKGTLYELVEPAESALACPDCGRGLVYENRTARDRGALTCPECGRDADRSELDESADVSASARHGRSGGVPYAPGARGGDRTALTRIVAGTALLGVAAGIALVTALRKK